ncbi:MAG: metal-dependent hydrolase [Candidatus Omnitrophica bacterium]|nr:metal-dependent hydrolase [Candidatus Omnitrophota bacterium]
MNAEIHAAVSFSLGLAIWFFTKSFLGGMLCLAAGIIPDIDHIIEFLMHYPRKEFSFERFYAECQDTGKRKKSGFKKLRLFFHSMELCIILIVAALVTRNIYVISVALGYASHMALDAIANPIRASSYFFIKRIFVKFDTDKLMKQ